MAIAAIAVEWNRGIRELLAESNAKIEEFESRALINSAELDASYTWRANMRNFDSDYGLFSLFACRESQAEAATRAVKRFELRRNATACSESVPSHTGDHPLEFSFRRYRER